MHICYGKEILNERKYRQWSVRFRSGDFSIKDGDVMVRPIEINDMFLRAILEVNPTLSCEQLAIKLSTNHTTVHLHLRQLECFLNL